MAGGAMAGGAMAAGVMAGGEPATGGQPDGGQPAGGAHGPTRGCGRSNRRWTARWRCPRVVKTVDGQRVVQWLGPGGGQPMGDVLGGGQPVLGGRPWVA